MSKTNMKLFILLALLLGGCAQVTVDEPKACDSTTITFPGTPVNPGVQVPPMTQSFNLGVGFGKDLITKALVVGGQLIRADGGDLGFLDEVMIGVAAPNGGQDLVLWDSQHNSGTSLAVTASDTNLVDYFDSNNNLTVNVTISTQQPPAGNWDVVADLCVSAEASKTIP